MKSLNSPAKNEKHSIKHVSPRSSSLKASSSTSTTMTNEITSASIQLELKKSSTKQTIAMPFTEELNNSYLDKNNK